MPGEGGDVVVTHRSRLPVVCRKDFHFWRGGCDRWRTDERHPSAGLAVPDANGREASKLPSIGVALDRYRQRAEPDSRIGFYPLSEQDQPRACGENHKPVLRPTFSIQFDEKR